VGTQVFKNLNPQAFECRDASISGIDTLVFTNDGTPGDLWLMDGFSDAVHLPVPEPTTIIAGGLLLLPFGASTLRIVRRNRAG
jgi:hypothetical protein